jgi:type IV pilus assembly protein PilN
MVKINLLPVRTSKKKETAKQQIVIFVAVLVGSLVACGAIYAMTIAKISATKEEIQKSEEEIKVLKAKIGEIDNLKKFQDEVRKKLDVLTQLRKDKAGPSKRLAMLSDSVPDRLWLTKYTENGLNIGIGGTAYNEELIADFMRNLMSSGEFASVELQVSEQLEVVGVKAKKFELACVLKAPKTELAPATK